jgi:chromosome partitioning protein
MVLNAKGGCGKSTLATNIASYFATQGASVALADYDPQRSSLDWLERSKTASGTFRVPRISSSSMLRHARTARN